MGLRWLVALRHSLQSRLCSPAETSSRHGKITTTPPPPSSCRNTKTTSGGSVIKTTCVATDHSATPLQMSVRVELNRNGGRRRAPRQKGAGPRRPPPGSRRLLISLQQKRSRTADNKDKNEAKVRFLHLAVGTRSQSKHDKVSSLFAGVFVGCRTFFFSMWGL